MATSRLVSVCFSLNPPTQCLTSARLYITTGDRFLTERHFWIRYHPDMAVQRADVDNHIRELSRDTGEEMLLQSKIDDLVQARERLQQDTAPMDIEALECVVKPSFDNRLWYCFHTCTHIHICAFQDGVV